MFHNILIPVDGSRMSGRAVDVAVDLAHHYGSSLFLLHVIRNLALPREILDMIAKGEITQSRMELLEDSAEIILENARLRCENAGISEVSTRYLIGDPARVIADYAKENDIDLIVLGAQGLDTQPFMLGGVARKLTNISEVACLLVK